MDDQIKTLEHRISPNAHCATVCPHKKGVLVAFYRGPECRDDQTVVIRYVENFKKKAETELYKKTGNCILWPFSDTMAGLIYSYFNDTDGHRTPTRIVHRWMYCSNWVMNLLVEKNEIKTTNPVVLQTQPSIGMLVRINPIRVHNEWILPLYHEHTSYGQIMKNADSALSWRTAGNIGLISNNGKVQKGCLIQPCLWYNGRKLCSLSRDITPTGRAWYSESDDLGETWAKPIQVLVSNFNNSITAINDGSSSPWLIWNHGRGRFNLVIGKWDPVEMTAVPYLKLNKGSRGSYPNYCIDYDGLIHIVHTDMGRIMHHIIKPNFLNNLEPAKEEEKELPTIYD